jgi:hypothetical protein
MAHQFRIFDQKPYLQANVVFFDDDAEENIKGCEQLAHERLRKGVESLGMIIERIKISKKISKIINGNGNLSRLKQNPMNDSDGH